jgi:hypothetical protein
MIAVVVPISVVELFEVVQIRIAYGEFLSQPETVTDISLDLDGSRKPSRRMHGDIALGAPDDELETEILFPFGVALGDDLVGSGLEPISDLVVLIG